MDARLYQLAEQLGLALTTKNLTLAAAESCTGGWIAQVVTAVPGSSVWFDRGFVTYSNAAKVDMLGVKPETLSAHGAVSAETAAEMASGVINHSLAEYAIAVTGIAGPSGGSTEKPVGTVYVAWAFRGGEAKTACYQFAGDRECIRFQTVQTALQILLDELSSAIL